MKPNVYIALDLETTGLDFEHDEIIEVALERFENGEPVENKDFRYGLEAVAYLYNKSANLNLSKSLPCVAMSLNACFKLSNNSLSSVAL